MTVLHTNAFEGKTSVKNTDDIHALQERLSREYDPDAWRDNPEAQPGAQARANGADAGKAGQGKAFDPRFTFTSAAALEYVLDEINLIQDLLPASGLAAFYGPPGCGKSFGAVDVAIHLGAGIPFAGKRTERAYVLYVVAEGGRRFRNRVKRAMEQLGVEPENVALELIHTAPNLGRDADDAEKLILAIQAQRNPDCADLPLVVIVDTLSRTMGGAKENDEGIGMFVSNCGRIEEKFGGLVIAIHHTGKDEAQGMRGWSGMHAACDCEWLFAETDKGHFVTITKFRDEPSKITWDFSLEKVEIDRNRYDEPVTTCIVQKLGEPSRAAVKTEKEKAPNRAKVKLQREFNDAFNDAIEKHGRDYRIDGDGPVVRAVTAKEIRPHFEKRWATDEPDKRARQKKVSQAFNNALKTLPLPFCTRTEDDGARTWVWRMS